MHNTSISKTQVFMSICWPLTSNQGFSRKIAGYQMGLDYHIYVYDRLVMKGGQSWAKQSSYKNTIGVYSTMHVSHVPQLRSCNYYLFCGGSHN